MIFDERKKIRIKGLKISHSILGKEGGKNNQLLLCCTKLVHCLWPFALSLRTSSEELINHFFSEHKVFFRLNRQSFELRRMPSASLWLIMLPRRWCSSWKSPATRGRKL